LQELAFDHVVETTAASADIMSTRPNVRRTTLDEEHDATVTLYDLAPMQVTAQVGVSNRLQPHHL
jgi:hypothetical protein